MQNKHFNFKQRSYEWHQIKAGKISSSNAKKIMKSRGLGVGGKTYCMEVLSGLYQRVFHESYVSKSMRIGIEREPLAAEVYESEKLVVGQDVGFIVYYTDDPKTKHLNGLLGISPDKLIGDKGGLEIKCPEAIQHTKNLAEDVCHDEYWDQIQMCLFVTGREWWDLISYNPDFKEGYQHKITRIYPDESWQEIFIERATQCKEIIDDHKTRIN